MEKTKGDSESMTLIFGARCVDGVVLVSDRLVKTGEKTSFNTDKIRTCGEYNWILFGAAGLGTLYEEFLNILPQHVNQHFAWINYQNEKLKEDRKKTFKKNPDAPHPPYFEYSIEDFKHDCVELLTEMKNRYSVAFENDDDCVLQTLFSVVVGSEAKLYYLDSINCLPAEVPESLFIGYGERVEIFRKCWNTSMSMRQSATLGAFTIMYVEHDEITKNVGVGGRLPQIWYIPDGSKPREILGDELNEIMLDVSRELGLVYGKLHSLFRS